MPLYVGSSVQEIAQVTTKGTSVDVSASAVWASDAPSIADVGGTIPASQNGGRWIVFKTTGTAHITAIYQNVTITLNVVVN